MENRYQTVLTKKMEVRRKMAQSEKRFRCGVCEAAVFENELKRNGQPVKVKKVAIQKRYKDDEGWKSTHSLDVNDIPKMKLALSKAYEYLALAEEQTLAAEEI
jgi:hypothetical protein